MRGRDGFDLCVSELADHATPRFACVDGERQLAVEEEKELQREGCTTLATTIGWVTIRHSCSGRREDQLARWSGGDGESTNELLIGGDGGCDY